MFLIALGGLSESGKSSVGMYLQRYGFQRIKIISIEREMMMDRGIISEGETLKEEHFDRLYMNVEETCREFLVRLSNRIENRELSCVSIESIYRPELSLYLKKELGNEYQCLFFEAPMSKRVERELIRLRNEEKRSDINYSTVMLQVKQKDAFKTKHRADRIREIADYVVDNSGTESTLYEKVDSILREYNITEFI